MNVARNPRNPIRPPAWRVGALMGAFLLGLSLTSQDVAAQVTRADTNRAPSAHAGPGWLLIGFVRDDFGNPVEGAEILIGSMATRATTDADGRFRLAGIPIGLNYVGARRIGYLPAVDLVRLSPTDTLQFMLEEIGKRLDTVKVRARAEAAWERDVRRYEFAKQVARNGYTLTDREIADMAPVVTSDLLRARNGFNVVGSGPQARVLGSRGRCSPTIFLDGQPLVGFNLNDIMPSTIKLMITYPSFSSLPVALQTGRGDPLCGVIAIISL